MDVRTGRERVLTKAMEYVTRDRNATHGDPEDNFGDIARLWSAYLRQQVEPHQVAAMMILVKISRVIKSPECADHWVDIAGYSACGGELAERLRLDKLVEKTSV